MIYFDHAATTKIKKEVIDVMMPYLVENFGNASSLYELGINSKIAIEKSRKQVANFIKCEPEEIYFTSGGTESDNIAIKGIAYANRNKGNHIITSKIEHNAILNSCRALEKKGFKVTYLDVSEKGIVDVTELKRAIRQDTILISVMYANNEIGTIQPIEEISRIAKINNIIFHTDAVQAAGNLLLNVKQLGIKAMSISGHKIYGPKGVGILYVNKKVDFEILMNGGHQENGKRGGTENVANIVGMGKAAENANKNIEIYADKLIELRTYFISNIMNRLTGIHINGCIENRLPGNINISIEGIYDNKLVKKLYEENICVSSGSACNSGNTNGSHVLEAIGLSKNLNKGAIRITFGEENTKEEVDHLLKYLEKWVKKIRGY